ncbi:CPBP family intramembrane glutamic endopeptidase [Cerasicoccus maritimus]|uniref:CPBP family intramembrane glutamic endopeptidase n=1 Tax=Cerasicoccus maritimus TaxID=490089 RepID=UPI00285298D6|nr:CPBP family intramembrane glutamic endopeptidase [Cerasicoccus maritimus]
MLERDRQFMLFGLSPDRYSKRGIGLFFAIYFGAMLFAGLTGSLAYGLVAWCGESNPDGICAWLVTRSFDKFVDRCRYIPILIFLPWLMVVTGLAGRSGGFLSANDLKDRPGSLRWFMWALVLGGALAGFLYMLQMSFTYFHPRDVDGLGRWLEIIGGAAVSALLIGLIEEILFRSLIFRLFYTAFKPGVAIFLASFIYAYLHFRAPGAFLAGPNANPGLISSLQIAGLNSVGAFLNFNFIEFANYTSLGALFCVLYLRARSLWAPIGLHIGIVFVMLIYQKAIDMHIDPLRWVFASGGLTNGIAPLILTLALTLLFAIRLPVSRR